MSFFPKPPGVPEPPAQPRHPFLTRKLNVPLSKSTELQTLLADFRARGGAFKKKADAYKDFNAAKYDYDLKADAVEVENLIPRDSRRFPVLYCSYANKSEATSFCEGPVGRIIEFNGQEDTSLRGFLEKTCFTSDDKCHHQGCNSSIFEHTRRFCHSRSSVCVTQKQLKEYVRLAANNIITWTFCTTCKTTGSYISLSDDSWNMSFAKFLQLRMYAHEFLKKPCLSAETCHQSLVMDHTQYFAYKNLVAIFEYKSLEVREILLPPVTVAIHIRGQELQELREEMKRVTMKCLEVSSAVHEKLVGLRSELKETSLSTLSTELTLLEDKERNDIRKKAGDIQVFLCEDELDTSRKIAMQDSLLLINRMIANYIQSWTQRIDDLLVKRREEKSTQNKSISSVSSTASINLARQSSSSVNDSVFTGTENSFSRSISSSVLVDSTEEQNQKTMTQKDFILACQEASEAQSNYEQHGSEEIMDQASNVSILKSSPSSSSASSINYAIMSGEEITPVFPAPIEGQDSREEDVIDARRLEPPKSAASRRSDISTKSDIKSSLKTIITELLNSGTETFEIESPFPVSEHYLLNQSEHLPVLVKDDDPGSIIAFTLASTEYEEELRVQQNPGDGSPNKYFMTQKSEFEEGPPTAAEDVVEPSLSFASGAAVFVKTQASAEPVSAVTELSQVEIKFADVTAKFSCRCYFPEHFRRLREQVIRGTLNPESNEVESEEAFIRSLATCIPWKAKGGKSKSAFRKTCDDRFVVKEMTKTELQSFVTTANAYFEYMENNLKTEKKTVLAKILGVYKVTHNSLTSSTSRAMYLLVMENLFYQRNITQKFDLKGSARNRLADTNTVDEVVLLDENLVRMLRESPLYVRPSDKKILQAAIRNDTQFLTKYDLLDYSLLVGLDEEKQILVVGIIDYVRSYTWDKKFEMLVKSSLPVKEKPTIVKPDSYRERFLDKMDHYFLAVPDPSCQIEQESKM